MADEHSPQVNADTEAEPSPTIAPQEVHLWLAAIKPSSLLPLLREPQFLLIGISAFLGFRLNAQSYANPLVRRRLAQAAITDQKFAEKLREMAAQTAAASAPPPSHAKPPAVQQPPREQPSSAASTDSEAAARQARKRREQRDEARQELSETREKLREVLEARAGLETEVTQLQSAQERQAQRIARLERQITKLQTERNLLLQARSREKSVRKTDVTAEAAPPAPVNHSVPSIWETAVQNLLNRGKYENVAQITEEVLRMQPDDRTALKIEAQALEGRGDLQQASRRYRDLIDAALARSRMEEAIDALLQYLLLPPAVPDAEKTVRNFLSKVRLDDSEARQRFHLMLVRLYSAQPQISQWLQKRLQAAKSPEIRALLSPAPQAATIDDPLPLQPPGRIPLSARRLIAAIDAGDAEIVEPLRKAVRELRRSDLDAWGALKALITQAAQGDASYFSLLRQQARGPVVVDASNVAWFDQDTLAHGRPRLRAILETRRALHSRGYFPVFLIGDAPLPHTIDDPAGLEQLRSRQELQIVDAGVDADEALLREAKRRQAPLLTNDYMADWDPQNEVPKIPFTISMDGSVQFLSDLAE